MSNRLFSKKAVIAFGVVALLGASAGAQAWDGYADRDDGRHAEVRHDWRKLHHDRQSRDYFNARARQAAYYGDYRAAHRYHRIAVHKQHEVQWDRHDLERDRYRGW